MPDLHCAIHTVLQYASGIQEDRKVFCNLCLTVYCLVYTSYVFAILITTVLQIHGDKGFTTKETFLRFMVI